MRSEDEIEEAYGIAVQTAEELDDRGQHTDAIAPELMAMAFGWVIEDGSNDDLLEQFREDYEELIEDD